MFIFATKQQLDPIPFKLFDYGSLPRLIQIVPVLQCSDFTSCVVRHTTGIRNVPAGLLSTVNCKGKQ